MKDEPISRGNIVREFTTYHPLYEVSFDLKPFGTTAAGYWGNVLHATIGGNNNAHGDRIPSIWLRPGIFSVCYS